MSALLETSSESETFDLAMDPIRESERLDALRSLNLLDTDPEERFDRITRLAAQFFQVPTAYVALVDQDRQWFKSGHGICASQSTRDSSFCQYTIHRNEPFIIPDTHLHPVGRNHPLVIGEPFVRFYAGVPLSGPRGQKIGTFCIVDIRPRIFMADDVARLVAFAALIEREVNLGEIIQTQNELLETRQQLIHTQGELNKELSDAAKYVRLMLPPPLTGEEIVDWQFHPSTQLGGDGLGYRRIDADKLAVYALDVTGHGLGSALLAVTAMEVFRNPAVQIDFTKPSEVIERVNRTFQMKDHGGKFFSVWYGVYSRSKRTLTYANAGHPPALMQKCGDCALNKTAPGGMVLGILPEIQIEETTVDFPVGSHLYLFTDGLYELLDPKGGRGSYDEFFAYLEKQNELGKPVWDRMLQWLDRARDKHAIDDDVSLLRFTTQA
jgi:sigma-B regulation protein RsbU (phosphoserine phosphatase)